MNKPILRIEFKSLELRVSEVEAAVYNLSENVEKLLAAVKRSKARKKKAS